jgi:hypothetical protein
MKIQSSCAGFSSLVAKEVFLKLGRFSSPFAEKRCNELGNRPPLGAEPESGDNLPPSREKVKPQSGAFLIFFRIFRHQDRHNTST